jgi:hypothetical protein
MEKRRSEWKNEWSSKGMSFDAKSVTLLNFD